MYTNDSFHSNLVVHSLNTIKIFLLQKVNEEKPHIRVNLERSRVSSTLTNKWKVSPASEWYRIVISAKRIMTRWSDRVQLREKQIGILSRDLIRRVKRGLRSGKHETRFANRSLITLAIFSLPQSYFFFSFLSRLCFSLVFCTETRLPSTRNKMKTVMLLEQPSMKSHSLTLVNGSFIQIHSFVMSSSVSAKWPLHPNN